MSDKDKAKMPSASAEARPDTQTPAKPVLSKDEVKPVEAKPAKVESKALKVESGERPSVLQGVEAAKSRPTRTGLFGGRNNSSGESKSDLDALAHVTGTSPLILAALKAAYGWTERTRLARADFLEKREAWLKRPAKEV